MKLFAQIVFILGMVCPVLPLSAQNETIASDVKQIKSGSLLFRFYPMPLFQNRFSFGLEKLLNDQNSLALNSGITLYDNRNQYQSYNGTYGYTGELMVGTNASVSYRKYLNNDLSIQNNSRNLFYYEMTGRYFYYDRDYTQMVDIYTVDSSTTYFDTYTNTWVYPTIVSSSPVDKNEVIHKIGFDVALGIMIVFNEIFTVDLGFGGGMRYSISNQTQTKPNSVFNPYYTGIVPMANLGIGIHLK